MKLMSLAVGMLTFGLATGNAAATQTFFGEGYSWKITSSWDLAFENNRLSINVDKNYVSDLPRYEEEPEVLFSSELVIQDGYYLRDINASVFGSYEMTGATQFSDGTIAYPNTAFRVQFLNMLSWNYLYYDSEWDEYWPSLLPNWFASNTSKSLGFNEIDAGDIDQSINSGVLPISGVLPLSSPTYSFDTQLLVDAWDSPSYVYVCSQFSACAREYAFSQSKIYLSHAAWDINVVAVPEPGVYAMLGLGLGLIGFAARRHKKAK